MFQADDRVKVLTPDGYAAGVVARVLPQWATILRQTGQ